MSDPGTFNAPSIAELQPHFPQFSIERFVAEGGMGAVYHATQRSVDRPVALKILPPVLAGDPEFHRRFVMEAKAMAKLSHRNLVQLYDFGQSGEIMWMIQEWVEGRNFYEIISEEERLAPEEAAALVAQVCDGLGYAHRQGIVHRDVKPANVMQDKDGLVKVMDFGLARTMKGGAEGPHVAGETRFATEEYSAPEIWDPSATIDHRADIFALGVLLYEALTGTRPTGTFRYPSELVPGLDPRFDKVVVQAMQRRPENRFQSCGDMLAGLREAITKRVSPPPQSPTTKIKLNLGTGTVPVPVATPAAAVAGGAKPAAATPPPAADSVAPRGRRRGRRRFFCSPSREW